MRRDEGGTADSPLGAAAAAAQGRRLEPALVVCGGGAKAVPEVSYRPPAGANAVGRHNFVEGRVSPPCFSLSAQHRPSQLKGQ